MAAPVASLLTDTMQNQLIAGFCKDQEARKDYAMHLNKDFNQTLEGEIESVLSKALVRELPITHSLLHEKFKKYKDDYVKFRASVDSEINSIDRGFIALFLENADARRDYAPYAAKKFDESAKISLTYIFISALKQSFKGTGFLNKLHNKVKKVWQKTESAKKESGAAESGAAELTVAAGPVKNLTVVVTPASGSISTGAGAVGVNSPGGVLLCLLHPTVLLCL
jgi:flagellar hook-basal body complex protein FliE